MDLGIALRAAVLTGALVLVTGCGEDVPTFPPISRDAGIECAVGGMDASGAPEQPCPSGQICLRSRCYDPCSTDADCALTEECSSGVCIRRGGPAPDAGPVNDAGVDPCEGISCEAPQVCHPPTGDCVECIDGTRCGGAAPVCESARGACRPFNPRPCGACNNDRDCMDGLGVSHGECLDNEPHYERVCLLACATMDGGMACPAGLGCQDGRCRPPVADAVSCTAWVAATDGLGCFADADCVGLGGTPAPGQCAGAMGSPDGGVAGRCLLPCRDEADCVAPATCAAGFCAAM